MCSFPFADSVTIGGAFVQVLEKLEEQAGEIEVDFTNSELMERLAEALKTYCICGGKDDDTFMIQCDDCEDWFHGRCVNVEVRRPSASSLSRRNTR